MLQAIERDGRGRLHRLVAHGVALLKARGATPDFDDDGGRFFRLEVGNTFITLGAPCEGDPRAALRDMPFSLALFRPPSAMVLYLRWPLSQRSYSAAGLEAGAWQAEFLRQPLQAPLPPAGRLH